MEPIKVKWEIGAVAYPTASGPAFVTESPVPPGDFRFQLVRTILRTSYFRLYEISDDEKPNELKRWRVNEDEPITVKVPGHKRLALLVYRTSGRFDKPWRSQPGDAPDVTRLVFKYGRKEDARRATEADVSFSRIVEPPLTWQLADVGFATSKAVPKYTELRIRVEDVGPGGEICIARSADHGDVHNPQFLAVFKRHEVVEGALLKYAAQERTPLAIWFRPGQSPDKPARVVPVPNPEDPTKVSFHRLSWARDTVVAVQFKFGVFDEQE
jgi:hypothetical protein